MGNPYGSCPKGWWHNAVVWRLCCYYQPPTQHSSLSNSPAWQCLCQAARRKTIHQAWFKECSSKTPIRTWQSAVCNHQYTFWSVLEQKVTFWYCIIPGNFSADNEHHSSRSWACCSHSRWHSDHETGLWTAHSESEPCCLISSDSQLHLNKSKFMKQPATFMCCVISAEGISPTEERIEAIKKTPCPENSTQLRALHRIINIRNLSSILQPLNQLLQEDQEFPWCPKLWIGLLQSKGIPLFLTCRGAWQSKPCSDSWKWHKPIWHRGCHASLLPQGRIQTHRISLKILEFSQKELKSNREGRPSHHFLAWSSTTCTCPGKRSPFELVTNHC